MSETTPMFPGDILIIGASAAGISAAKEIRRLNLAARVTILSDEPHLPYYRPLLTKLAANESVEQSSPFLLAPEDWYRKNDVTLVTGERAAAILPSEARVRTESGRLFPYDRLILATGSCPFIPIPGVIDCENVFAIRTIEQAKAVHRGLEDAERAVVIGGGILGLEMADVILKMGKRVCVAEMAERILPIQLDPEGSNVLETTIRDSGCPLFLGDYAESLSGAPRVTGVKLKSGGEIPADLVIFSIGVRSNTTLAIPIGITTNRGILVNERMETNVPGIYACGDVAEFRRCICLWMPAVRQGTVAGANAAGGSAVFTDEEYPSSLNAFGTTIFSVGDLGRRESPEHYTELRSLSPDGKIYKKLYFRNDALTGGILLGDNRKGQALARAVRAGIPKEQAAELMG